MHILELQFLQSFYFSKFEHILTIHQERLGKIVNNDIISILAKNITKDDKTLRPCLDVARFA